MNVVYANDQAVTAVDLSQLIPSRAAIAYLSEESSRRLNVVALAVLRQEGNQRLVLACEDPHDVMLVERLRRHIPRSITPYLVKAMHGGLSTAIRKCYTPTHSFEAMLSACAAADQTHSLLEKEPDYWVRLLESLLLEACQQRASDIHVSPDQVGLSFRLRVDGVLKTVGFSSLSLLNPIIVRIKVLASLDIAETRLPQDGQFSQLIEGQKVDFRVSTFPTMNGENTVLRILSEQTMRHSLERLSLKPSMRKLLSELVRRPDGLLLFCGPTGSGKSTTLYSLLNELDQEALNIMTLEDPVERSVVGIRQTNIDADRQLGFAQGVRALLRQDPDVLLIGEIRDAQSCSMALRAANTGHLVLSTVHAATVFTAITRLRELGVQGALLASNLVAIASQRLVRKRCTCCSIDTTDCAYCQGTGFHGRQVILELLIVDESLSGLIAVDAPIQDIEKSARDRGFVSLRDEARELVDKGISTEGELLRVLGCH
ncbi:MAG: GspE/PulE family protein [Granulosicoccus sp.]